jgi:hypothetical protein
LAIVKRINIWLQFRIISNNNSYVLLATLVELESFMPV